jgi:tripartite-type tricarboxylate transporter receptor subunit TctC
MLGWGGFCVPAGTPSSVIKIINAQTLATILSEPLKGELEKTGYEIVANTPEEFREFMKTEIQRIETLVKQRGIQAEQ